MRAARSAASALDCALKHACNTSGPQRSGRSRNSAARHFVYSLQVRAAAAFARVAAAAWTDARQNDGVFTVSTRLCGSQRRTVGQDDIMRTYHQLDGLFGGVSMPVCRRVRRRSTAQTMTDSAPLTGTRRASSSWVRPKSTAPCSRSPAWRASNRTAPGRSCRATTPSAGASIRRRSIRTTIHGTGGAGGVRWSAGRLFSSTGFIIFITWIMSMSMFVCAGGRVRGMAWHEWHARRRGDGTAAAGAPVEREQRAYRRTGAQARGECAATRCPP